MTKFILILITCFLGYIPIHAQSIDTVETNSRKNASVKYSIQSDLPKAIIYAVVSISPEGNGSFIDFAKGSTNRNSKYADAIKEYLKKVKFNKANLESKVIIQFKFDY